MPVLSKIRQPPGKRPRLRSGWSWLFRDFPPLARLYRVGGCCGTEAELPEIPHGNDQGPDVQGCVSEAGRIVGATAEFPAISSRAGWTSVQPGTESAVLERGRGPLPGAPRGGLRILRGCERQKIVV